MFRVGDLVKIVDYEWNKDLQEPVKVISEHPEYYDILIKFNNGEEKIHAIPKDTLLFDDTYDIEILQSTIDAVEMIDTDKGRTFRILPAGSEDWEVYKRYDPNSDYIRAILDAKALMVKGGRKLREKRYQYRGKGKLTFDHAKALIEFMLMNIRMFEINGTEKIEVGIRRFERGEYELYVANKSKLK